MRRTIITHQTPQHAALLELIEYALCAAEAEIACHTLQDSIQPGTEWGPDDIMPWIDLAQELAVDLDALEHVIDQAAEIDAACKAMVNPGMDRAQRAARDNAYRNGLRLIPHGTILAEYAIIASQLGDDAITSSDAESTANNQEQAQ